MSVSEVNCHWGDYEDDQCPRSYPNERNDNPLCEHHPYEIIEIRCYLRPRIALWKLDE